MSEHSVKVGVSFGATSGVITTLGLMMGLNSGTGSKLVVIGGILTIAIADAFSDALGIHVSEESENVHTPAQVWIATISTFLSKFIFALTFVVPVLLFKLPTAVLVNVIWGLSVLFVVSYKMAKAQNIKPLSVIMEHIIIALTVIVITHYLGHWIAYRFN
ncbi:MAG: hypothetical protein PHI86_07345 [Candidatus Omnitrophica bacterium]|nr:hypothetical protein [Candidatus Omnitrophota bacterium]HOX53990.1 hypothetical protein [Candidatus Omnitrophota bacterium]